MGCFVPHGSGLPQIAIPGNKRNDIERAFLISVNKIQDVIVSLVVSSPTLQAWSAMRLPRAGMRDNAVPMSTTPQWGPIWDLIRKEKAIWNQQYTTKDDRPTTQWELHKPSSVGELYACAMFVLYHCVQDNPRKDGKRIAGLKRHRYYHDEEGKYLLLYNFLTYMGRDVLFSDRRVTAPASGSMKSAIRQFQRGESTGWHLTFSRNDALLTIVDNNWDPMTLNGYMEQYDVEQDKSFTLVLDEETTGGKVFKLPARTFIQSAEDYFTPGANGTLSTALCIILGWSNKVTITDVSTRFGGDNDRVPEDSITEVLEHLRTDEEPWVWLETSSVGPRVPRNINRIDQTDYTRHPILQLETWVDNLTEQHDVEYAKSLFTLLRRNHRRNRDFVEYLTTLFAPFKQLNTANSKRSRSLLDALEGQVEAESHPSHLEKMKSMAAQLDETSAEDARAIFRLVERGFGSCREYMEELKVVFGLLQDRNAEELERAVQIKVFDAVDKEADTIDVG